MALEMFTSKIEKGMLFSSYEEFLIILKKHQDECGVLYVKGSSKKLRKKSPYLESLQYQFVRFNCKQGNRTKESTSQGFRPNQKTLKMGCPAFIRLVEDQATCKLKVSGCHLVHENHLTGQEFSQLYPENRRPNMSSELKTLLSLKSVSVRDIQNVVRQNDGKIILGRDVWNLKNKLCDRGSREESENVEKVLERLQEGEVTTEAEVFEKMDHELPASIKMEQPDEDVEYLGQESMGSYSLLPGNTIKLEPACETDDVHSSAKVMVIEAHAFDEMDIESPASVKQEQTEEDVEHSDQETPAISQNCPYLSAQDQPGKPETSDVLYKDKHHMFTKVIDVAGCSSHPDMTGQNNTVSRVTGNSHTASLENKNCGHISQDLSSVFAVNTEISLTDKNCQLQNNMEVKTGDKPFVADVGDPEVGVDSHLSGHKKKDAEEESIKYDLCGASLTSADSLKLQKGRLTEEKPYECEDCGSVFTRADTLKSHRRTHTGEKRYWCEDCGAVFTRSGGLKIHRRTHTGEKPYKCDDCGASFTESGGLLKHKRKHTGESPFKCDECGAIFTHSSSLKAHKRTHTGEKPYKCDDCGAVFTRSGGLKTHKRTHTGEKPYKCDDCGVYFAESTCLAKHKRTHTGERPYKCDDCGSVFTRAGSLKTHKRIHTGERPYKCDDCGACFTQINHVNRHKRIHTGEKP